MPPKTIILEDGHDVVGHAVHSLLHRPHSVNEDNVGDDEEHQNGQQKVDAWQETVRRVGAASGGPLMLLMRASN
ncbi:hypothetical protein TYRP_023200 [Tyrophagus putrescentiae]|nr:hypothetical protein TYRP_023200 [Tyrophagus putrescentiae]